MTGKALESINGASRQRDPSGRIERLLWMHHTDRWYFGDFLRHAVWLRPLLQSYPGARIDLASHPEYLDLYADDRFNRLLDARRITGATAEPSEVYDLVIVPGPFEPHRASTLRGDLAFPGGPLILHTWDSGWELHGGAAGAGRGSKTELNYFRAAHPASGGEAPFHSWGAGPVLPGWLPPVFTQEETARAEGAVTRRFPGDVPVIVYNPTASNAFTRDTDIPKEVGNALSAREHGVILRRLLALFPGHAFLVASALKDGDNVNTDMVSAVAHNACSDRVAAIFDLAEPVLLGLRGFASLLASQRICSSVGSGTGTNTHLAALLDVPSLSIERGADSAMLANWTNDGFQMGSFRWRNPAACTAIHVLNWSERGDAALEGVAVSFLAHHSLHHGSSRSTLFPGLGGVAAPLQRFHDSWPARPVAAVAAAGRVLELMRVPARRYYSNFTDEAAYLSFRHGLRPDGLATLAQAMNNRDGDVRRTALQLFQDSNLHKLLTHLHQNVDLGASGANPALLPVMAARG